jgi:hypothetical protein
MASTDCPFADLKETGLARYFTTAAAVLSGAPRPVRGWWRRQDGSRGEAASFEQDLVTAALPDRLSGPERK